MIPHGEPLMRSRSIEQPVDVSILIVSYNAGSDLEQILAVLCEIPEQQRRETIVVDNASQVDTQTVLDRYAGQIRLIRNRVNRGFASAVNQAFEASSGRYLLLLNPDTVIHRDVLDRLVEYLDQNPSTGAVAPSLIYPDGRIQPSRGSFPNLLRTAAAVFGVKRWMPRDEWIHRRAGRWLGHLFRQYSAPCSVEIVDYTTGACVLIRRSVFERLGGLDERFFLYYEEIDLALRMRHAGDTWVFLGDLKVMHSVAAASGQAPLRPYYERARSLMLFYRKHKPAWQCLVVYLMLAGRSLLQLISLALCGRFRIEPTKKKAEEKATIASIFGLLRLLFRSDQNQSGSRSEDHSG